MKTRMTSTILFFAILLAGCGGMGTSDTTEPDASNDQTTDDAYRDGLPADLDFGGAEVKFHASLWMGVSRDPLGEYYAEEQTGDVVNDAVFLRNQAVEDRLNVNLTYTWHETVWDTHMDEFNFYRSAIMAGDDAFDIVSYIAHFIPSLTCDGTMLNMADMKYIDFTKPWWAGMYLDTAKINDNLYFAVGDIALGYYLHTYCMYFNSDLIETLNLENPYDLVESGKWTLDKLRSMSAESYSDLNGNSTEDDDDRWGLVVQGENIISGFMEASNVNVFKKTENGRSYDYIFGNEHNVNVVQKMCQLIFESDGVLYSFDGNNDSYLFIDGNTVFSGGWFADVEYYRNLTFDYGILPYPKYDEAQEEYYTRLGTACPTVAVPVTTKDPDMISAVLEVMAAEGYYQMRPAYFDMALKNKYSRDERTKDMVDMIVSNITVDFGTIFVYSLDGISDKFKNTIKKNNPNWVSLTESWKSGVMTKMDSLIANLNK